MEQTKQTKQKPAFFLLRAVIAFVLLGLKILLEHLGVL